MCNKHRDTVQDTNANNMQMKAFMHCQLVDSVLYENVKVKLNRIFRYMEMLWNVSLLNCFNNTELNHFSVLHTRTHTHNMWFEWST